MSTNIIQAGLTARQLNQHMRDAYQRSRYIIAWHLSDPSLDGAMAHYGQRVTKFRTSPDGTIQAYTLGGGRWLNINNHTTYEER